MELCTRHLPFTAARPCFTLPLPASALKLTTMDWIRKSPVFLFPHCRGSVHGAQAEIRGRQKSEGAVFGHHGLAPPSTEVPWQIACSAVTHSRFWEPCSALLRLDLGVVRALHSRYSKDIALPFFGFASTFRNNSFIKLT